MKNFRSVLIALAVMLFSLPAMAGDVAARAAQVECSKAGNLAAAEGKTYRASSKICYPKGQNNFAADGEFKAMYMLSMGVDGKAVTDGTPANGVLVSLGDQMSDRYAMEPQNTGYWLIPFISKGGRVNASIDETLDAKYEPIGQGVVPIFKLDFNSLKLDNSANLSSKVGDANYSPSSVGGGNYKISINQDLPAGNYAVALLVKLKPASGATTQPAATKSNGG